MDNANILKKIKQFLSNLNKKQDLNCIINDTSDIAIESLKKFTKIQRSGPLAGKLIAIKDNLNYINTETTCGSHILRGHKSIYNANENT